MSPLLTEKQRAEQPSLIRRDQCAHCPEWVWYNPRRKQWQHFLELSHGHQAAPRA